MSVALHFAKTDPKVQATYRRLIEAAQALGPVTEEAKIRAGGAAIVIRDCRLTSIPDAVVTKAYAPILITGLVFGAIAGWIVGRRDRLSRLTMTMRRD